MAEDTQFVRGAAKLSKRIRTIRERLRLPPLTDEIGALLYARTMTRFSRELTPDNAPWAELAPATLRRKASLGFGDKQKLERTGKMKSAIQVIRGRADGGTFFNTGAGLRIGIVDQEVAEYAAVQNKGNEHIPGRRFLGLGALDIRAVDALLRRKARQLERQL